LYEQFYGLRERPFELVANLRFLFLPEPHREALNTLSYGISSGKGITVLIGDAGAGKTMLLRAAMADAGSTSSCVLVTNPRLTRGEFFELLVRELQLGREASQSKVACLGMLGQALAGRIERGEQTTLIVDEAQSAPDDLLEEIRLLTNMEGNGARLLSIVFAGQPEFAARLSTPALRSLKQRVALWCTLRPFTLAETAGYIAARISVAGGAAATLFTGDAVQAIHEASGGLPRVISILCDNALVGGLAANERPVTRLTIDEVCHDCYIDAPAALAEARP
jgi:general secretion pathway protein A